MFFIDTTNKGESYPLYFHISQIEGGVCLFEQSCSPEAQGRYELLDKQGSRE